MTIALKGTVGLIALLMGILGLRWMFAPAGIATEFGLEVAGTLGLNTARGDLGGMFIAASAMCVLWLRSGDGRWLQAVAILIGCIAVGRLVGIVLDGFAIPSLAPMLLEFAIVAVLLRAARGAAQQAASAGVGS